MALVLPADAASTAEVELGDISAMADLSDEKEADAEAPDDSVDFGEAMTTAAALKGGSMSVLLFWLAFAVVGVAVAVLVFIVGPVRAALDKLTHAAAGEDPHSALCLPMTCQTNCGEPAFVSRCRMLTP